MSDFNEDQELQHLTFDQFPEINRDLLKLLDQAYPDRHPHLLWTDRRIWWKAGERAVVDMLWEIHDYQQGQSKQQETKPQSEETPPLFAEENDLGAQ
jgi:hypothetical protein